MFVLNAFKMKKKLHQLKIKYSIYRISNFKLVGEERYRVLNDLARKISNKYRCLSIRYTQSEDFNGIIVFGNCDLGERFTVNGYEFILARQDEEFNILRSRIKSYFYEILRAKLEYHGFWASAYNKYYRFSEDDIIDRKFRIFRGFFFRFEILNDGTVLLVLDPLTRIVSYDTVYELASQWGYAKAMNTLKGRYVVALVIRKKNLSRTLLKIHAFRPDLRAGIDKLIEINGRKYTIKEYYSDYLGLPKVANLIPDDAPIIVAKPLGSNKILYLASSMAYLNYRTNEISPEYVKKVEKKVFLEPDQRLILTKSFMNSINPLNYPYNELIGKFEFEEEPLMLSDEKAGVFNPPMLKFGKDSRTVDLEHYTKFFKKSLRELGVAKGISIPIDSRLAVVYPENYITDNEAKSFYKDIVIVSKKVFGVTLPRKPYLWGYRDNPQPVVNNYYRFKDDILAVIAILRTDNDELYVFYKNLFKDRVSQMATVKLVRLKEQLPREELHKYRNAVVNLVSGLLGKLGLRPWLLGDRLKADAYIGIDLMPGEVAVITLMNSYGNYIGEIWVAQRGSKISASDMYNSLYQLVVSHLESLDSKDKFSLVVMKDGDVYDDELEGIKKFVKSLSSIRKVVKYTVLSVKKSVPYRIYRYDDGNLFYPYIGSYAILGEEYGILASSGYPLIKKRLAKPLLIEVVEAEPKEWYGIHDALYESYMLSFMHWSTLTHKTKYPAPIKYADDLSSLLSQGIRLTGLPL